MNDKPTADDCAPSASKLISEMIGVIEAQRSHIRQLEEAEFRLREQDSTFVDSRIGSERRELFSLLERLHTLMPVPFGESAPETSDAAVEGFKRLVMERIIKRIRPDLASRNPNLEAAELGDDYERELGDGRR